MDCAFDETRLAEAIEHPRRVFVTPASVVRHEQLSRRHKLDILNSWLVQEKVLKEHIATTGLTEEPSLYDSVSSALEELSHEDA